MPIFQHTRGSIGVETSDAGVDSDNKKTMGSEKSTSDPPPERGEECDLLCEIAGLRTCVLLPFRIPGRSRSLVRKRACEMVGCSAYCEKPGIDSR